MRFFVRVIALLCCLAALAGVGGSIYAWRQVERIEAMAQDQVRQVGDTLDRTSGTLRTVSGSAGNAADSIDEATASLSSASDVTDTTARVLNDVGEATDFQILDVAPFEGLGIVIEEQVAELETLADQLDTTAGSLERNSGDLRDIRTEVGTVADRLDENTRQLRRLSGEDGESGGLRQATHLTRVLLGWSVVIHVLLLGIGISLLWLSRKPRATGRSATWRRPV